MRRSTKAATWLLGGLLGTLCASPVLNAENRLARLPPARGVAVNDGTENGLSARESPEDDFVPSAAPPYNSAPYALPPYATPPWESPSYDASRNDAIEFQTPPLLDRPAGWDDDISRSDATGMGGRSGIRGGPDMIGGPTGEKKLPGIGGFWLPARSLRGQPGTLATWGESLSLSAPVAIVEQGIWLANFQLSETRFDTTAALPSLGRPFPDQLWSIQAGVMHIRSLDNGWTAGGMINVGSASDRPFASVHEMTINFLAFASVPSGERNAWNFSLMYSPVGQLPFPIPGVAYQWRPNDQFQANIGVPFSLKWRPSETLTLSASYLPLVNVQAQIRWEFWQSTFLYGAYGAKSEGYFLADRPDDRERLYAFDQRLSLGLRRELGRHWAIDGSAAYVFDRSYFLAERFSDPKRDAVAVENGWGMSLRLEYIP